MLKKFIFIFFIFLFQINCALAQLTSNKITSIVWENNILEINTEEKITHAVARLTDPDRLVVDILNCSFPSQEEEKERNFKSQLGEKITITEPIPSQVRIVFLGSSSINRKAYLTNNEKTLIIKIARIYSEEENETGLISETKEQSKLERFSPGKLKEITIKQEEDKSKVTIGSNKSIKYNTYILKNPYRFAIDLLNILPPEGPLPTFNPTLHLNGLRIGRAASGVEATRLVVDLTSEEISVDVDSNLLGNKLEITFTLNKEKAKKEEVKKSNIKVVIDPGHGGYDVGASHGGFEEKQINLVISKKLKKLLEELGITVFITREDDDFLSLAERVEITKAIRPNAFISVHANALVTSRGIRGVETYYWTPQSQKLAYLVHKSILNNVQIPDHFIRKAKFYVIRHVSMPAILAELGFLSNREDRGLLTNANTQDKYAKALSQAILNFLDVELKVPAKAGAKSESKKEDIAKKSE